MFNGEIMFNFKRVGIEKTSGVVVFIDMNTYVLNSTNFKTFLKENYAMALLGSCYLLKNAEYRTEHDVLIVLMEFAYIRHS